MGIFSKARKALGGGSTVREILGGAGNLAKDIREAATGEGFKGKMAELETSIARAQAEINKVEAQSGSVFVAGWRPALAWLFVIIIGLQYLVRPVAEWIILCLGETIKLPALDIGAIWPVLTGILGLGVYRTIEKARGVQDRH